MARNKYRASTTSGAGTDRSQHYFQPGHFLPAPNCVLKTLPLRLKHAVRIEQPFEGHTGPVQLPQCLTECTGQDIRRLLRKIGRAAADLDGAGHQNTGLRITKYRRHGNSSRSGEHQISCLYLPVDVACRFQTWKPQEERTLLSLQPEHTVCQPWLGPG